MISFNAQPALLRSVQIGKALNYGVEQAKESHDQPWTTGFYKSPVDGPVFAGPAGITGDEQADHKHHGGADKAVLAYSGDHYLEWRNELSLANFPFGAFGEHLTIEGSSEASICIGDLCQIGDVVFEVSQPRQPCWKLARRWRTHELTGMVVQNGRTGWYLRVLQPGSIEAGMAAKLVDRPNPEWSIARANEIMHHRKLDSALTLELADVPRLANSWVKELRERAEHLNATRTMV